jgi:hypothetical protein
LCRIATDLAVLTFDDDEDGEVHGRVRLDDLEGALAAPEEVLQRGEAVLR